MTGTDDLRHDDGSPRPYEIVEEFWPYDGPHSRWTMSSAAVMHGRLVRYLNNSTQYGMPDAPGLGSVIGGLSEAVWGYSQLLEQLAAAAVKFSEDPSVYDDRAPRTAGAARAVALELAGELDAARAAMKAVTGHIDRANNLGGRLGHYSEGEQRPDPEPATP